MGFVLVFQSDVIRKPQGQMELNSSCRIARGEGAQTFQVSDSDDQRRLLRGGRLIIVVGMESMESNTSNMWFLCA
jgi:hypothetical protein